jgi:DNA-binding CsgD family transcriptional regulator
MNFKNFSKKELTVILDIIHSVIACKNEIEIKQLLEKTKELVCADYSICGLGLYNNTGVSEAISIINGSYPEEWFTVYEQEKLYEIDPIVSYHCKYFETQLWAETYKKYKDSVSPKFISDAGCFGLKFGITSGTKTNYNNLGSIITFSNNKNHFKERHKAIMDIIIPHLHQALLRVHKESKREKEILYWMREGKSNWEISMILNISERTVKFHIQNIERKLDAVNKTQAVAVAMDQELIL